MFFFEVHSLEFILNLNWFWEFHSGDRPNSRPIENVRNRSPPSSKVPLGPLGVPSTFVACPWHPWGVPGESLGDPRHVPGGSLSVPGARQGSTRDAQEARVPCMPWWAPWALWKSLKKHWYLLDFHQRGDLDDFLRISRGALGGPGCLGVPGASLECPWTPWSLLGRPCGVLRVQLGLSEGYATHWRAPINYEGGRFWLLIVYYVYQDNSIRVAGCWNDLLLGS